MVLGASREDQRRATHTSADFFKVMCLVILDKQAVSLCLVEFKHRWKQVLSAALYGLF